MIWGQQASVVKRNTAHAHDLHELVTCTSGAGRHWVNGMDYEFAAGRTIFLPSGHSHFVEGTPEHPAQIAFVCFDQAFLAQTGDENFQRAVLRLGGDRRYASDVQPEHLTTALQLMAQIQEELTGRRIFAEALVASLARELLVLHCRATPPASRRAPAPAEAKIARVTRRLADTPGREVSLDEMAQEAGMSRSAFTREFRNCTGMSPVEYVQDARIRLAMSLLGRTEDPVSAVAQACGFRNLGHFHTVFRSLCGMSPRRYRCSVAGTGPFTHVFKEHRMPADR